MRGGRESRDLRLPGSLPPRAAAHTFWAVGFRPSLMTWGFMHRGDVPSDHWAQWHYSANTDNTSGDVVVAQVKCSERHRDGRWNTKKSPRSTWLNLHEHHKNLATNLSHFFNSRATVTLLFQKNWQNWNWVLGYLGRTDFNTAHDDNWLQMTWTLHQKRDRLPPTS